jgi:hypothetical protein
MKSFALSFFISALILSKAVDEGFVDRNAFETDTDARFQKLPERLPKAAN